MNISFYYKPHFWKNTYFWTFSFFLAEHVSVYCYILDVETLDWTFATCHLQHTLIEIEPAEKTCDRLDRLRCCTFFVVLRLWCSAAGSERFDIDISPREQLATGRERMLIRSKASVQHDVKSRYDWPWKSKQIQNSQRIANQLENQQFSVFFPFSKLQTFGSSSQGPAFLLIDVAATWRSGARGEVEHGASNGEKSFKTFGTRPSNE